MAADIIRQFSILGIGSQGNDQESSRVEDSVLVENTSM